MTVCGDFGLFGVRLCLYFLPVGRHYCLGIMLDVLGTR
jgi:hypothetical protein